ncbi:MAG: AEC family transporter [Leucobacter sp.]
MTGVLYGFVLILAVIGTGYLTARFGIVKGDQRRVLNNVAFYVATPMLLFSVLRESDPQIVLSPVIAATTIAAVAVAALYLLASRLWFRQGLTEAALGATTAGYVNSNNLGLPVAIYILGDATYVAPLILVQLIVFSPVILALLEAGRGNQRGALKALGRAVTNPIIIASVLGFLCALFEVPVPQLLLEPIDMIGAAAIPMILLSFGISLRGQRALEPGSGRASVLVATGLKVLGMPLIAWGVSLAIGLSPHETFIATTIAALPTAQNIYNYAATYRRAETMVRDTILITTFASLPVIAGIAWLLAA